MVSISKPYASLEEERGNLVVDELLLDDAAACLVREPASFDVIVTSNLYGDVLSSIAAVMSGGVGLLAGASYGDGLALFEAAHGSAPKYEGQDVANPAAIVLAGALLLHHLGEHAAAARVERAVCEVVAEGDSVTRDLAGPGRTVTGTRGMVKAILRKLASGS